MPTSRSRFDVPTSWSPDSAVHEGARGAPHRYLVQFALVAAVAAVATVCLFASRFSTNAYWQDHADTLIIEMVGRDLMAGGRMLDWRLTQAPYLFPDIALAMAAAPFVEIGQIGRVVQFSLLIIGSTAWFVLARRLGGSAREAALIGALFAALFGLSFFHAELGSTVALYFGLPGHHSSMSATLPIALLCMFTLNDATARYGGSDSGTNARELLRIPICWLVLAALALSDGLLSVSLIAPAAFLFGVAALDSALRKSPNWTSNAAFAMLLASVFVAAEAFHRALTFPQKNEFFRFMLERVKIGFPAFPLSSARGIAEAPFESVMTFTLFLAAAIGIVAVVMGLRGSAKMLRADASGTQPVTDLVLWSFLLGTALIPLSQIALGLWTGIDASRQLAWALLAWIMLGAIQVSRLQPRWGVAVVAGATIAMSLSLMYLASGGKRPAYESRYRAVVACLAHARPAGFHFVGDFWDVLPITVHSQGRFSGIAFADPASSPAAFTNGQKVTQLRTLAPTFVAVRPGFQASLLKLFGAPVDAIRCEKDGLEFWDYGHNPAFVQRYTDAAKKAY